MKKLTSLFILFVLFILAGCQPSQQSSQQNELLLDSFEGKINATTVDFGSSDNSKLEVEASGKQKFCGKQSLKLSYRLKPSGYMWAARGYNLDVKGAAVWLVKPKEIDWSGYNAISLAMYGQDTGAVYAFDLKDKGGEMWRYIINDNFKGWRELICPFKQFFPRGDWQPEGAKTNQVLDFPIMSYQFEPKLPGKGEVYFDCVKLVATESP